MSVLLYRKEEMYYVCVLFHIFALFVLFFIISFCSVSKNVFLKLDTPDGGLYPYARVCCVCAYVLGGVGMTVRLIARQE